MPSISCSKETGDVQCLRNASNYLITSLTAWPRMAFIWSLVASCIIVIMDGQCGARKKSLVILNPMYAVHCSTTGLDVVRGGVETAAGESGLG